MKKEFNQFKKYLKLKRGNQSRLAQRLGYANNSTVARWVMRGVIPEHQRIRIMKMVERELRKAS